MSEELLAKIKLHTIDNPISTKTICEQLELQNEGQLRTMIHELRMAKHKIASKDLDGKYGYFIARDKIEMQPTIEDIKARAFSLLELVKHMEDWNETEPRLF